jgi:hypothetical protein
MSFYQRSKVTAILTLCVLVEGITGVGVTRGMLRPRTDDHFMLKSEMHWNIK